MTPELVAEKLADLTDLDKDVLRYIRQHAYPQRSDLATIFTLPVADEATRRGIASGLIDLDTKTHRYSIRPVFLDALTSVLFPDA